VTDDAPLIVNRYECEVCGRVEHLTEKDAFDTGWDYPPFIGEWGVVSPRTCGAAACGIQNTAYWAVLNELPLTVQQAATIKRITEEVPRG
jgi:hypothetical protein